MLTDTDTSYTHYQQVVRLADYERRSRHHIRISHAIGTDATLEVLPQSQRIRRQPSTVTLACALREFCERHQYAAAVKAAAIGVGVMLLAHKASLATAIAGAKAAAKRRAGK